MWYAENEIGNIAAVKILNEDLSHNAQIVERFRNEAKITVKLKHPNIRQVYDFATIDGRPCMVMEYLEGDDLHSRMKHGERFTDERIKKWWNQLASALNYTHAQGIVHRDIKPSNVFIDGEDNVKLLDFGIAKVQEGITMTQTGATMGTLMYMSPEQVLDSKHIDAKTDCYSLAVSFVHLLTGNAPYDTTTTNDYSIRKGIVEVPLDLTGVPTEWQSFLQPYLAKNPAERPALREFSAETSHSGFVPPIPPSAPASEETFVGSQTVAAAKAAEEGTMIEGTAPTTKPSGETVVQGKAKKQAPAKPKKKRKGLIIGIIVAAVLLVGGGVTLALLLGGGGGNNYDYNEPSYEEEIYAPEAETAEPVVAEETTDSTENAVNLTGTKWEVRMSWAYLSITFTSDHTLTSYGYYIDGDGEEGYGAWRASPLYYSLNGNIGQIYSSSGGALGDFYIQSFNGHPNGLVLTTYNMEPGDYGDVFYLE